MPELVSSHVEDWIALLAPGADSGSQRTGTACFLFGWQRVRKVRGRLLVVQALCTVTVRVCQLRCLVVRPAGHVRLVLHLMTQFHDGAEAQANFDSH